MATESNQRKRNAPTVMFQRALFALQKNNDQRSSMNCAPPKKRARVTDVDSASPQHSGNRSFHQPPPREPTHGFLHDRSRAHVQPQKVASHTPSTRSFRSTATTTTSSLSSFDDTRHHRHRNHHHHHHHNHHHHQQHQQKKRRHTSHDYKTKSNYHQIELNRMKKLWTDFTCATTTSTSAGIDTDTKHDEAASILAELHFCRDTSYFITSNSIAHKMSMVVEQLLRTYLQHDFDAHGLRLLDALACIGGNTYSFAKQFSGDAHTIFANELDHERFRALRHNMSVFKRAGVLHDIDDDHHSSRFQFYNLDFLQLHATLGAAVCDAMDVIFLDPEWNNGDDYKQTTREQIHLFNIGPLHLHQVVDQIISQWYRHVQIVAIKVAKNYDQQFLTRKLKKCKAIQDGEYRIGEVSFHNQIMMVIVKAMPENTNQAEHEDEDDNEDQDIDIAMTTSTTQQQSMSFETALLRLPQIINKNETGTVNIRDVITVKVLL